MAAARGVNVPVWLRQNGFVDVVEARACALAIASTIEFSPPSPHPICCPLVFFSSSKKERVCKPVPERTVYILLVHFISCRFLYIYKRQNVHANREYINTSLVFFDIHELLFDFEISILLEQSNSSASLFFWEIPAYALESR